MTPKQIAEAADYCIAWLTSSEGRDEMRRIRKEQDAYFKRLREQLRPTWEDLHRPFDI